MVKRNKIISILVAMATVVSIGSTAMARENYSVEGENLILKTIEVKNEEVRMPKQVNVHMGEDFSIEVNITHTIIFNL